MLEVKVEGTLPLLNAKGAVVHGTLGIYGTSVSCHF